ncbi:SRPBCC domain-containing protein [Ruania halotolerans]|uniref:SRPBCC domain-containing protein n=1 Tax=Ruania halotolerans TaxID=2897773 RepID=UPI001E570978|nr:SRPBCC domain-containing protein [Ruania halotolerans]UFU07908.1 SRPBCC domain-containing protein [Ruania halotolerans]
MNRTDTNRGTLGIGEDGTFRIHFERHLPHTPDRVWAWLTEPELLERWLPGCSIDARHGGAVTFDFGEEGTATGTVTAAAPPQGPDGTGRLVHGWVWEGVPDSEVVWHVEPTGSGTLLTLTHREVLAEPAAEFAVGWHVMLDALSLAADGRADAVDAAWANLEQVAGNYM